LNIYFLHGNNINCIIGVNFECWIGIVMHKSIVHRTSALILTALMLTASTGFTIDMHYCGGKMQSFSLFGEADSCYAMDVKSFCAKSDDESEGQRYCTLTKKKCCEDRMLYVQPVENLNVAVNTVAIDLNEQVSLIVDTYDWSVSLPDFGSSLNNCHYRPPVLLRTTPVILQSFLI